MDKGWQDTLNPMTLMPWTSREEYTQFWRLPQQQREQRIRASRNAMANPAGTPQSAPQTAEKRHPGQTCDNSVLSYLQAEKNRICSSIPGESCSPKKVSPKRLDNVPCSTARQRIQAIQNCLNIRQFIQEECFNGIPDEPHTRAMNELKNGIAHCLALEARNCAPGHPMSER
jgi:Novel toxin 16